MTFQEEIRRRVLRLDGAMGTQIQLEGLGEEDYRAGIPGRVLREVRGDNECLNLSRPDIILKIHGAYIEAGADITVPIIPGLKPLTSRRQVKVLPETFSIDLPLALTEAVEKAGEHAEEVRLLGIQWCIDQCRELLSSGVPAVHFYTMSRSDSVAQVLRSCF